MRLLLSVLSFHVLRGPPQPPLPSEINRLRTPAPVCVRECDRIPHYESLSIKDICKWPVEAHAQEDSVLFLWVPVPLLFGNPGPREVMEAWGYTYKNEIVWDKVKHMLGHYVSNRHENLLIATRGKCAPDRLVPMQDNVVTLKQDGAHSEKPKEFRTIIERLYDGPYLELWSRHKARGWDVLGGRGWKAGRMKARERFVKLERIQSSQRWNRRYPGKQFTGMVVGFSYRHDNGVRIVRDGVVTPELYAADYLDPWTPAQRSG